MKKNRFGIPTQKIPTVEQAYGGLIGFNPESEKIAKIKIDLLDEIEQDFAIREANIDELAESINLTGLHEPIIVRAKENGRYDILAGRHRTRACQKLGYTEIDCIVRDVDEKIAEHILLATNLEREQNYLPSELAKAYKHQDEIVKSLGGNINNDSKHRKKIYRYKRLNLLIPEMLEKVDKKEIPLMAGVNFSFLSESCQQKLLIFLEKTKRKITVPEAEMLRNLAEDKFYFAYLTEFLDGKPEELETAKPDSGSYVPEIPEPQEQKEVETAEPDSGSYVPEIPEPQEQEEVETAEPESEPQKIIKKYNIDTIKFCTDIIDSLLVSRALEYDYDNINYPGDDTDADNIYRRGFRDGYFELLDDIDNLIGGCNYFFEAAEEEEKANELKNGKG